MAKMDLVVLSNIYIWTSPFCFVKEVMTNWEGLVNKYETRHEKIACVAKIAALKQITKEDFTALFEEIFFSDQSKRIDLSLTSATHTEEQELLKIQNSKHFIFSEHLKRIEHKGSLSAYKASSQLFADVIKNNWTRHRNTKL